MSLEVFYLLNKDESGANLRDLDDVVLLNDAVTDEGITILAGTEGTVVAVWDGAEAYEVEFAEPEGAMATVPAKDLKRVGPRSA
jgi:hypothetical protein